jgi:outer membrane protein assembly factor BamB
MSQPTTMQTAVTQATTHPVWPAGKPASPESLPGDGLAQHDFFYAGEAKTQDMYIVRGGQITWAHHDAVTKGEISDATLLSNGNILFAHQHGVSLIDRGDKVLWNFDAPAKSEIHTAQAIGKDRVLFIINGPEPRLMVANITTNAIERQFPLPVKNLKSTHGQFRHARLTDAGTLLVAHMDLGKVVEYDETGKQVWSIDAPGCWSACRLKNGNTLIACGRRLFEVNPAGQTVWEFAPADIPDYKVLQFQIATRLPNGNTLVNNWVNQWNASTHPATAPVAPTVQAWEITPDKQIAWALRSWTDPENLGPATVIQLLDIGSAPPEDVHFGTIH